MNLKVGFFYVLLILTHSQFLLPISNCLANCYGCDIKNPIVCFNQVRTDTGQQGRCLPYYDGNNCNIGNSYYVPLATFRISTRKMDSSTISPTGRYPINLHYSNAQSSTKPLLYQESALSTPPILLKKPSNFHPAKACVVC